MKRRIPVGLALLLVMTLGSAAEAGLPYCLPDWPSLFDRIFEAEVPLGCDLIDCCPLCPLDGSLDLKVLIEGAAVAGGKLHIRREGFPVEVIDLPRGETLIPAVVPARSTGPVPIASVELEPARATLARWQKGAEGMRAGTPLGHVEVRLEQLLGKVVVNGFRSVWPINLCSEAKVCDEIVQTGNTDSDESVLMVDARRQAGAGLCVNDELRRAVTQDAVGQLLAPAGCRSEVAVFSTGDSMKLDEEVAAWSDQCGDRHPVLLEPILEAPAHFFLAIPDFMIPADWGSSGLLQIAQEDLKEANQIYDANKSGISFTATMHELNATQIWQLLEVLVENVDVLGAIATQWDPISFVCSLPPKLESLGFYKPGVVNVYYVPVPGGGMICPDDRNVVFIALGKKEATLAHELGHSLSLLGDWGHANGVPGFDSKNVMWVTDDDVRDHFSLGQVFRQNVEESSMINVNGVRPTNRPRRTCGLKDDSPSCTHLTNDWSRP